MSPRQGHDCGECWQAFQASAFKLLTSWISYLSCRWATCTRTTQASLRREMRRWRAFANIAIVLTVTSLARLNMLLYSCRSATCSRTTRESLRRPPRWRAGWLLSSLATASMPPSQVPLHHDIGNANISLLNPKIRHGAAQDVVQSWNVSCLQALLQMSSLDIEEGLIRYASTVTVLPCTGVMRCATRQMLACCSTWPQRGICQLLHALSTCAWTMSAQALPGLRCGRRWACWSIWAPSGHRSFPLCLLLLS